MGGFHTYHTLLLAADNGQTHPIKAVLYCTLHTLRRTHTHTPVAPVSTPDAIPGNRHGSVFPVSTTHNSNSHLTVSRHDCIFLRYTD